ncbi:transcription antiterminator [Atopobium sp. oral taxon 199]|uniref:BglG family transcription antiterminator n=1 Tax=Atopobium sp. oral taxon 199 TaxID=712156 RepID=UPI00034E35C8|nr:PRD domain-containing protein [Atopobium sp. oral taxon 199]EPD78509.1 hypothetical protein HMPREF1527_00831 [Atopobium sp. oral taxon 199 str. F0494]
MDDKVARLIRYMEKHGSAAALQLSEHLGVSKRTVRSYIKRANSSMNGSACIVTDRCQGYRFVVNNTQAFSRFVDDCTAHAGATMPQTSNERVAYLVNDLLNRSEWITVDELAALLFVSRKTISSDLKRVEKVFERFHLSLERRSHYGIHAEGAEMDRRLCLASLAVDDEEGHLHLGSDEDDRMIAEISSCVAKIIEERQLRLTAFAQQNLVIHIVIAIKRIRQKCYVPMGTDSMKEIYSTYEFAAAQYLIDCLSEIFDVAFPRQEVAYIAIHLASKKTLARIAETGNLVVSDDIWSAITEMLELIWENFRFDFRNDLELRINLARHIVPLAVRLRYRMPVENPLLVDIKRRMPLAYLMAVESSGVLAKKFKAPLSEEEIGYIALAFALALERQKTELPKKSVLTVCASGMGTSRLLAIRVREEFGPYIGSVESCDLAGLSKVDFSKVDYVFSTVPIVQKLPVPVCQSGFLLDDIDMSSVRRMLRNQSDYWGLTNCFFEDLFFPHLTFTTKDKIIEFLCREIEKHEEFAKKDSRKSFAELVRERERLARTAFGNNVALPHPVRPVGERTVVAIGLLEKAIDWSGTSVRAVFLISISRHDDEAAREFNQGMASLLMNEEVIASLLEKQNFSDFIRQIVPSTTVLEKED